MARLRIRVELNRRMAGVPLDKMASVVEETRKFFYLLAEDVSVEADRGEWLASDFDPESLNFTAEYTGPVSAEQVKAFGAAFSGATSLRKATIAQFTRIADFLGEDELVGFGLYQSDEEPEPGEWRCLSKRDALRFGEEIKLLAEAAGESPETQLPAVMNGSVSGRRLFRDRREEVRREREALLADPSKILHEMESNLSRRIGQLESEVSEQNQKLQQMLGGSDRAEERFQKLLAAMETFWTQAPRQLPLLPEAPSAPLPDVPTDSLPAALPEPQPASAPLPPFAAHSEPPKSSRRPLIGFAVSLAMALLAGVAYPDLQREWMQFTSVETLVLPKPKPPAAPNLPTPAPSTAPALVKTVARQSPEPFVGPLIPLDIPATIKPKIQSEVRVDVVVAIDREGRVTGARVASTKGESADLLVTEALRAARQSRFQPALEGKKKVRSRMILTFLFKPVSDDSSSF